MHALCVFSAAIRKKARCAIYTRKSSEEGLEQVSTPEEKCIGFPEQKYISEAGKKGR